MKSIITICLVLIQCIILNAQEDIYKGLDWGAYQVGFRDTLILDEKYNYQSQDYNGKKPYFVQIWHPIYKREEPEYLRVKDFYSFQENADLKVVQEHLKEEYKNLFIRDYLSENLLNGEEMDYGSYSYEDVFKLLGELETKSIRAPMTEAESFPVIVYYHGSQGLPFENFVMAEYFASRGFIFVSASFELQFENCPFGMLPFERFHSNEYEESLKTVTHFAKSLSNSTSIFFVGHSFGAQMGLRTFGQDASIKGMVSLETTLEFKSDDEKIKEMWPEVYNRIITEKTEYPFPIMFCAATGEESPFYFFQNVRAPQIKYVSTYAEFEHNAYLSIFYLRYFLDEDVRQADKRVIAERLPLYLKHLNTIYAFIEGSLKHEDSRGPETQFISE